MKIKAIITGSTGMVGEGVLHECLNHPQVDSVLVINRKPCGIEHEKLKEIIHKDFLDISLIRNSYPVTTPVISVPVFHPLVKKKMNTQKLPTI